MLETFIFTLPAQILAHANSQTLYFYIPELTEFQIHFGNLVLSSEQERIYSRSLKCSTVQAPISGTIRVPIWKLS